MTQVMVRTSSTPTTIGMWYNVAGGSGTSTTATGITWPPTGTSTSTAITSTSSAVYYNAASTIVDDVMFSGKIKVQPGQALELELPDGAVLEVQANGSYKIVDTNAKVIYKASRVREFNRYLNASDLLEEFIKFVAGLGKITKREFFDLPVELFIQWLVIRAAEADGEEHDYSPVVKALPNLNRRHTSRCKCCGKFVKTREFLFCNIEHMNIYAVKNVFAVTQHTTR